MNKINKSRNHCQFGDPFVKGCGCTTVLVTNDNWSRYKIRDTSKKEDAGHTGSDLFLS